MKKKFIAGFLAASLFVESFFSLGNSAIADAMSTTYQGSAIDMTSKAGEKGDSRKTESKKGLDDSDKSSTVDTVPEGYTAVRTIDDLCAINNAPRGKYILMNDIDLTEATKKGGSYDTGHGWTPIERFSGTFDGNGKKIKGMHIYGDEISEAGLFGRLYGGTVKNLAVVDCDIDVYGTYIYAGAIAGYSKSDDAYYNYPESYYYDNSIIEQCYTSGKIAVNTSYNEYNSYASGIVGKGVCYIRDCYSNATLIGKGDLSGAYAIGCTSEGRIYSCYFAGNIECDNKFFGDHLEDCYYLNTCYTTEKFSGAKPLTQTQMRNKGSFTNWDFENVWYIEPYSSYQCPQLRSNPQVKLSGMEVVTLPAKTAYEYGEDVSLDGTTVKLIYDDGYSTVIDASKDFEIKYDNTKLGMQEAILSYEDISVKIPIVFTGEEVTDIELTATSTTISGGEVVNITAVIKPEKAFDKKITWSLTDINGNTVPITYATISEKGEFCGKTAGTYVITATANNGVSKSVTIKVIKPIIYLIADPQEISMSYGETVVINLKKSPLDSDEEIFWKSSNEKMATVEDGKVTALAPGHLTITAYTNSGAKAICNVNIVKEISACEISGIVSQKYTGDEIELEDLQVYDINGPLEEDIDYTVSYENNVEVGTATVTIEGIGKYKGSISKEFEIVGKTYPKMSKISLGKWKKISKKNAKVTKYEIKWKGIKNIDGYEIVESKFNKNKWSSSKKTTKKTSYVYSASSKKYTKIKLKVRPYRYENGKKVYGQWSKEVATKIEFPTKKAKAKSIYFSGIYEGSSGSTIGSTISLSQYSSQEPEEKKRNEVATFEIDIPHAYGAYKGVLIKIGENKYRPKKKGLEIKVYEKKIVVKVTNKRIYDKELAGTYKLVKRLYS